MLSKDHWDVFGFLVRKKELEIFTFSYFGFKTKKLQGIENRNINIRK